MLKRHNMIRLFAIGGYNEVGKNMSAIEIDDDVIIVDCGLYLPPIVEIEEKERSYGLEKLRDIGAVPDDLLLDGKNLRDKVRAILISHAHLDHVGALPYLANRYNANIVATPFTIEVLKSLLHDSEINLKNELVSVHPNASYTIRGKSHDYNVEFIGMTHSTIQATMIAIHTPYGAILYANDFKFDNSPILGKKPNFERLRELGKEGVIALIVDSLYAETEGKTPSEKIARTLVEDVLLTTENKNSCIIVTTFSSHIARLKSIVEFGKQMNRKIIFWGRSLRKYVDAANRVNLVPFMNDITMLSYRKEVDKVLKQIEKNRDKYLIVCTGHQGEPGSVMDRLSRDMFPLRLRKNDHVIFSSRVIPTPINIANKQKVEKKLKERGVRIFSDAHTSGHAYREDLRDLIKMLRPKNIFPAHGEMAKLSALAELATEEGYELGKNVHIMRDGQSIKIE